MPPENSPLEERAFIRSFRHSASAMVLTDPTREDNSNVHDNRALVEVTGDARSTALDRDFRLLQGENTNFEIRKAPSDAIERDIAVSVDIPGVARLDGTNMGRRIAKAPIQRIRGVIDIRCGCARPTITIDISPSSAPDESHPQEPRKD